MSLSLGKSIFHQHLRHWQNICLAPLNHRNRKLSLTMTTRNLESIGELIQSHFEMKNQAREAAIALSRTLIRQCANTIRAVHRREWQEALTRMAEAEQSAR